MMCQIFWLLLQNIWRNIENAATYAGLFGFRPDGNRKHNQAAGGIYLIEGRRRAPQRSFIPIPMPLIMYN